MTVDASAPAPGLVRLARWAPAVSGLALALVPLLGVVAATFARSGVRAAPGDLCGLVPAGLLGRLVPTPGAPQREPSRVDLARCMVSTDRPQPSAGYGALVLEVERHGGATLQSPADRAQDWYAGLKRTRLEGRGVKPQRVVDVPGLGDDAYVTTDEPSADRDGDPRGFAIATVLAGDTVLTVSYTAEPSTDALATAAAVSVARAVLGGVR
ncbi:hypothetical protein [Dactylosporangium sp. NPDC005555]|uniref:hypothetical protein n=1 Tax=Dactylosporangium sp. NPDC005555 TaxID=3154889 RepID=UPI0033A2B4FD